MRSRPFWLLVMLALAGITAAYSNHFNNGFHFDDTHTIVENAYIRDIRNIPSFFLDGSKFSVLPMNRTYRPIVSATIAIDYWLSVHLPIAHKPQFWFHLSTFLWFFGQLTAMYWLFRQILDHNQPRSSNRYAALFAACWYGLHPAIAETVNYIIQRGDIYSTAGVVAGITTFACFPKLRYTGLYMVPVVIAQLSKPPALVFPVLLTLYILYFDIDFSSSILQRLIKQTWFAWALTAADAYLQAVLTPKSYTPIITSKTDYLISQPFVWLRYFGNFLLPVHLSADTDLVAFHTIDSHVLLGFLFVAALMATILLTGRRRRYRPISYGLCWFVVALLPTSLYPLQEVENDHRMYFAFVGLVLAATWSLALMTEGTRLWIQVRGVPASALKVTIYGSSILMLICLACATFRRNEVWHTEKSLWRDVFEKSPRNPRGLMTYGMTLADEGKYNEALSLLSLAEAYKSDYPALQVNLGVLLLDLKRNEDAGRHFETAVSIAPNDDRALLHYAIWLDRQGYLPESREVLQQAFQINPQRTAIRDSLIEIYTIMGDLPAARQIAEDTVRQFPGEQAATAWVSHPPLQNEKYWLDLASIRHQSHHELSALAAVRKALTIDPASANGYHKMAAIYAGMEMWSQAAECESKAIALKPDFADAKDQLGWIHREMELVSNTLSESMADDLLKDSDRFTKSQQFSEGIAAAQSVLRLRPNEAPAYDSLATAYVSMHRWDEAIEASQAALRLNPQDQTAEQHLSWATLAGRIQRQTQQ